MEQEDAFCKITHRKRQKYAPHLQSSRPPAAPTTDIIKNTFPEEPGSEEPGSE